MAASMQIGILLFHEVEVLDFAAPFEVFALAETIAGEKCFSVFTVSQTGQPIRTRGGLTVTPAYGFADAPRLDAILVPGGYGAEKVERYNPAVLRWVRAQDAAGITVASVCTGAFILAAAGLLDGRKATTHWMDTAVLQREYPAIDVQSNVKFVDEGRLLTSGGISAGIHLALHLVSRWAGVDVARRTAKRMAYDIDL